MVDGSAGMSAATLTRDLMLTHTRALKLPGIERVVLQLAEALFWRAAGRRARLHNDRIRPRNVRGSTVLNGSHASNASNDPSSCASSAAVTRES